MRVPLHMAMERSRLETGETDSEGSEEGSVDEELDVVGAVLLGTSMSDDVGVEDIVAKDL